MNVGDIQFSSADASLKIVTEGVGSASVPTTSTSAIDTITIPHTAGTDDIIWQVGGSITDTVTNFVAFPGVITPFSTFDGRIQVYAVADAQNLYVTLETGTGGSPVDAQLFNFSYRILVP